MPKFRLDRVKEVKEKLLDDKKAEMQSCLDEFDKISNEIRLMDDNIKVNYDRIAVTTLTGKDYCVLKEYIIHLEGKKCGLIAQKEDLISAADSLRSQLVELLKGIKMLDILKSKMLRTIKKSENRREQKIMDELALRLND